MKTECIPKQLEFEAVGRRKLVAAFDAEHISSECGGRRRVLAYVTQARGVRAILEHLGLPTAGASLTPARAPPQNAGC